MPTNSLADLALALRERMAASPPRSLGAGPVVSQPGAPCSADCPHCGGVGWLRSDLPVGHPQFGRLIPCPNVIQRRDFSRCGLDENDRELTWEAVRDVNNAKVALDVVRSTLEGGRGWVYLWGRPGLAKSLLLKVAVAEALRLGREAAYVDASALFSDIRRAFDSAAPSSEAADRLAYWAGLPVLALDELDKINETGWLREVRFSLLNRRYEDGVRGKSITLIASQTDPARLPEELASRVSDGRFETVRVQGDDVRPYEFWYSKD